MINRPITAPPRAATACTGFPFPSLPAREWGRTQPWPHLWTAGAADTVWHRLYIEAIIPQGCALRLWLAAGNEANASDNGGETIPEAEWFEHRFGEQYRQGGKRRDPGGQLVFPGLGATLSSGIALRARTEP